MARQFIVEPACRTTADLALWLLERMAAEGGQPDLGRLHLLLFLARAEFAESNFGRWLVPACFLRAETGVLEPNLDRLLIAGIANPWLPEFDPVVLPFLNGFWSRHVRVPTGALRSLVERIISPHADARIEAPKPTALPARKPAVARAVNAPTPEPEFRPLPPGEEVRFTGDGRAVTRWRPRRRLQELKP